MDYNYSDLTIIIMAGGQGKRMNSSLPKVLHKFMDIPFLVRIIHEAKKLNPNKIVVIVGKDEELIQQTLSEYNITADDVSFVRQPEPNGTGNAIKCSLDYIENEANILILNGDMPLIKSKTLSKFISSHENSIMISKLEDPQHYGRIIIKENKFVGILEYKDCNEEERKIDLVNVGIYYFKGSILKTYIHRITNENSQKEYYLTDLIKLLTPVYEVVPYLIDQDLNYQILGINTKEELDTLEKLYGDHIKYL